MTSVQTVERSDNENMNIENAGFCDPTWDISNYDYSEWSQDCFESFGWDTRSWYVYACNDRWRAGRTQWASHGPGEASGFVPHEAAHVTGPIGVPTTVLHPDHVLLDLKYAHRHRTIPELGSVFNLTRSLKLASYTTDFGPELIRSFLVVSVFWRFTHK